jgi:hypothetical protein
MRGLVASPAARLATATATASDGPQGHLRPLKQPEVFWSDWIQRTCNRLGDITSVHEVPKPTVQPKVATTPLSLSGSRTGTATGWSVSASECTTKRPTRSAPASNQP